MDQSRRRRISEEEWARHKGTIQRIYVVEDRPLLGEDGLMRTMERDHGFSATKAQYETQLKKKWHFRKYSTKDELFGRVGGSSQISADLFFSERVACRTRDARENARVRSRGIIRQKKAPRTPFELFGPLETQQLTTQSFPLPIRAHEPIQLNLFQVENDLQAALGIPNEMLETPQFPEPGWSTGIGNLPFGLDQMPQSMDVPSLTGGIPSLSEFPFMGVSSEEQPCTNLDILRDSNNYSVFSSISIMEQLDSNILRIAKGRIQGIGRKLSAITWIPNGSYAPEIETVLESQSVEARLIYSVVSSLINRSSAPAQSRRQLISWDPIHKGVLDTIYSQSASQINHILDSIPPLMSQSFQEGMFWSALEAGSTKTVDLILKRGLQLNRVKFRVSNFLYTPLERSSLRRDHKMINLLASHGADPNTFCHANPLALCLESEPEGGTIQQRTMETLSALLKAGAIPERKAVAKMLKFSDPKVLTIFVQEYRGPLFKAYFETGFLPGIHRFAEKETALRATKNVLDNWEALINEHSYTVTGDHTLGNALVSSLAYAVERENFPAIDMLLCTVRPNNECLIRAVRIRSISLIERFLQIGTLPDQFIHIPCFIWDWQIGSQEVTSAIVEAIQIGFTAAVSLFETKGPTLAELWEKSTSKEKLLTASHKSEDKSILLFFLECVSKEAKVKSWGWIELVYEAIKAGNEEIIIRVLGCMQPDPIPEVLDAVIEAACESLNLNWVAIVGDTFTFTRVPREMPSPPPPLLSHINHGRIVYCEDVEFIRCVAKLVHPSYWHRANITGKWGEKFMVKGQPISIITLAILERQEKFIELLIDLGVEIVGTRTKWDIYPPPPSTLSAAILARHSSLIDKLFDLGADPVDDTAFFIAVRQGNLQIVKKLVGLALNTPKKGRRLFDGLALSELLKNNDFDMISVIVSATDCTSLVNDFEKDRNAEGKEPFVSPLGQAILSKHPRSIEILKLFLDHEANPN
ncbi:hypothetical protein BS50DRAFT_520393, partial [Corynespora cassiicola Philippines]